MLQHGNRRSVSLTFKGVYFSALSATRNSLQRERERYDVKVAKGGIEKYLWKSVASVFVS